MKLTPKLGNKLLSLLLPLAMLGSLMFGSVAVYSATSDSIDNPVADSYQEADFLNTKCRVIAGGVASVCEPLNFANQFMASSGKLIGALLKNDTANSNDFKIGSCNNAGGIETICSAVQGISYAMIILLFLLLIFGNAFSGVSSRLFDSYSIKKTLPKLLVAIAGITFGGYLVGLVIDIVNIISANFARLFLPNINSSVSDPYLRLIEELFVKLVNTSTSLSTSDFSSAFAGITLLTFIALTGTVMVLLTLAIRFVVLSILVVTIPISFALSSLPSTSSYIKKSFSMIVTIILMEPMTVILFAVSYSALKNIPNNTSANSAERTLLTMLIATIPFFIAPFTYKFAKSLLESGATFYNNFRPKVKFDREAEKSSISDKKEVRIDSTRTAGNRELGSLPSKTITLNSKNSERIANQLSQTQSSAETVLKNNSEKELTSSRSIAGQPKEATLASSALKSNDSIKQSPGGNFQNSNNTRPSTPRNELNGRKIEERDNEKKSPHLSPTTASGTVRSASPRASLGKTNFAGNNRINFSSASGAENSPQKIGIDKYSANALADKIGHSINTNGVKNNIIDTDKGPDFVKGKDRLQPTNPELDAKREVQDVAETDIKNARKIDGNKLQDLVPEDNAASYQTVSSDDLAGAKITDSLSSEDQDNQSLIEDLGQIVLPDNAIENQVPTSQIIQPLSSPNYTSQHTEQPQQISSPQIVDVARKIR